MDIDTDRIDDAVLALMWLGLHDGARAWKSFDWDAMDRLHTKGLIHDPVSKAKVRGSHAGGPGSLEAAVPGTVREALTRPDVRSEIPSALARTAGWRK